MHCSATLFGTRHSAHALDGSLRFVTASKFETASMSQVFHRSTNTIARLSIFGLVFLLGALLWLIAAISRSSYITETDVVRAQPVPFSHEHHVAGLGIDCRYCHTAVEVSSFAGIPPTATCMNCHSQIWSGSDVLKPLRDSFQTGAPIRWTRVHNFPDFVYFDHSIHVNKGRRLRDLPWPCRSHAAHVAGPISANGMVSRLPSRAGTISAPARAGFQHELAAGQRTTRTRTAIGQAIQHPQPA